MHCGNIIYQSRLETTLETTALGIGRWFLGHRERGNEREGQRKSESETARGLDRGRERERDTHTHRGREKEPEQRRLGGMGGGR